MAKRSLYWNFFRMYENCPQCCLWSHGQDGLDLGQGPGRPRALSSQSSMHHIAMGKAVQSTIERLYNDRLWMDSRVRADQRVLARWLAEIAERELEYQLARSYIDYSKSPTRADMVETCVRNSIGYLSTMKAHRLLGPYARSEVHVGGWLDKYTGVAGRLDVLIKSKDHGVLILEGKNSHHREKYVDSDQLRWYALAYWLQYRKLPDKLALVFYHYPYGTLRGEGQEPDTGLDWIDFTEEQLVEIAKRAQAVQKGIWNKVWVATPKPSYCRFCEYETICSERSEQKRKNSAKRQKRPKKDLLGSAPSDGLVYTLELE